MSKLTASACDTLPGFIHDRETAQQVLALARSALLGTRSISQRFARPWSTGPATAAISLPPSARSPSRKGSSMRRATESPSCASGRRTSARRSSRARGGYSIKSDSSTHRCIARARLMDDMPPVCALISSTSRSFCLLIFCEISFSFRIEQRYDRSYI
jgi:hypothetical protein